MRFLSRFQLKASTQPVIGSYRWFLQRQRDIENGGNGGNAMSEPSFSKVRAWEKCQKPNFGKDNLQKTNMTMENYHC